jgi:Ca2+-binding EF-hand superfamily protein
LKSQFHAIDKNKDGVLDKKEIKEGMKLIIGKTNRSEKDWQEFYKKIDIDGDG